MGVGQGSEDDPFGDLGAVDTRGCSEWDGGGGVDWGVGDVVRAGREEVDQFWDGIGQLQVSSSMLADKVK